MGDLGTHGLTESTIRRWCNGNWNNIYKVQVDNAACVALQKREVMQRNA